MKTGTCDICGGEEREIERCDMCLCDACDLCFDDGTCIACQTGDAPAWIAKALNTTPDGEGA